MDLNTLKKEFFELFGATQEEPRLFFAPGRVNLIGEHTDYNGGFVLPCALQYGTYLLIRKNPDHLLRLATMNFDFNGEFMLNEPPKKINGSWTNYPLGIYDQFLQRKITLTGFDMLYAGDIPQEAGLSSSASMEMVTAYAWTAMMNATELEMTDLIYMAKRAENEFVGLNCGIMDMFAIGMAKKDHALFLNCNTLEYKNIPLILKDYRLLIINTNKKRELTGSAYNERVAECQLAVTYLSRITTLSKLSEIGFMQFFKIQDQLPDPIIRRRARHVISENQRVLNSVPLLLKSDLLQFGSLMNASHESLRDNYEVTGPELDALVEAAWNVNGCVGARMTGAGFGGCTVNLVAADAVDKFTEQVGNEYYENTGLHASFYPAETSDGVREITHD